MAYKFNVITGKFDLVTSLTGTGTSPVSQKTVYATLYNGACPVVHNANAEWNSAEVMTLDLTTLMAMANSIRKKYEDHRVFAGGHPASVDAINIVTEPDCTDWITMYALINNILTVYTAHNADAELAGGWAFHAGVNTIPHLSQVPPIVNTYTGMIAALNALELVFNAHDNDAASHPVVGTCQVALPSVSAVWNDSLYVPRQDPADVLNSAIIDSVVSDLAKVTFYF